MIPSIMENGLYPLLLLVSGAIISPSVSSAQTQPLVLTEAQAAASAQTEKQDSPSTADSSPTPATDKASASASDYHAGENEAIVVTGFRHNREDVLSGTAVVTSERLVRELRPTIGETLSRQAGVSATSFGPSASRPVLRGFQGDRVRVLIDGIGSLDVSSTSTDHAVAINPLTAQRIEVLRGPAALLFGSAAIGGVVNVVDARVPRSVPDEAVHIEGIAGYGAAANERSLNTAVNIPIADHFVLHVDGNYSKSDDLGIGGHVLARTLRDEAIASPDAAIRALAALKDKLPNTAARTADFAAGVAYVDGDNNIGFSINRYDSLYGVPIRYSLEPGIEAEAPRIDVLQTREDFRAELDTQGFIDTINIRGGYADYRHNELDENGTIGTTFLSKGMEGRLEFLQVRRGGWGGGFGAQYFQRNLDVTGDEKFLPGNRTSQWSLFALESLDHGAFKTEAGARFEHQIAQADADADLGNPRLRRAFNTFSAAIGTSYKLSQALRFGVNLSHSQRAPSTEELFANGPHAGTQAFEIGDPDLTIEKNWGVEGTLKGDGDGYSYSASIYHSWFSGYIFEAMTGAMQDDLPVFQTTQGDARYFGFELEGSVLLANIDDYAINLDVLADYVRATIGANGPAPRIPPLRLLVGIEAQSDRLQGRIESEWVNSQNRLASFETSTAGFVLVNASLAWSPLPNNKATSLTLSANNLFNVEARRHASVLKDYAPLSGRDIRLTARINL